MWDMRLLRNKLCLGIKTRWGKRKHVFIAQITLLKYPWDNAQTAACIQSFPRAQPLGASQKRGVLLTAYWAQVLCLQQRETMAPNCLGPLTG